MHLINPDFLNHKLNIKRSVKNITAYFSEINSMMLSDEILKALMGEAI